MVHHKRFRLLVCVSFLLFVAVAANAQATRTWVSGVGDDVNPCSRTAPCKTFAGAISKTATNGEINCLDPAGYGSVTITKSITIDCEDTQGSILASLTNGIIINITSPTDTKKAVRIRGISINGAATGINAIRVMAATNVSVEEVVIDGFTTSGITVEGSAQVAVRNSSIRATLTGINASPASGTADVTVTGSSIAFNTNGIGGSGKLFSFGNNVLDANATNGTPTSTTPLK